MLRVGGGRRKSNPAVDAEQGEISGTAFDSNTNLPLAGVTVSIPDHNLVTETDEDGFYLFSELVIGTYRVACSCRGYKVPVVQTVEITADASTVDVDFGLDPTEGDTVA